MHGLLNLGVGQSCDLDFERSIDAQTGIMKEAQGR